MLSSCASRYFVIIGDIPTRGGRVGSIQQSDYSPCSPVDRPSVSLLLGTLLSHHRLHVGSTDELAQDQLCCGLFSVDPSQGTADICGVRSPLWSTRQFPSSSCESELCTCDIVHPLIRSCLIRLLNCLQDCSAMQ